MTSARPGGLMEFTPSGLFFKSDIYKNKKGDSHPSIMGAVKDSYAWSCQPINLPVQWWKLMGDTQKVGEMLHEAERFEQKLSGRDVLPTPLARPVWPRLVPKINQVAGRVISTEFDVLTWDKRVIYSSPYACITPHQVMEE